VLSHGNTSSALSLDWFGYYFASHGYVVAAVNHHGNTSAEPGGPVAQGFGAVWERPRDLSVLIDKMLGDPFFGPHIDANRIAAAGHSSGGATVLETAGAIFDPDQTQAFCKANKVADPNCDPPPMIRGQLENFAQLTKIDAVVQASVKRSHLSNNDPGSLDSPSTRFGSTDRRRLSKRCPRRTSKPATSLESLRRHEPSAFNSIDSAAHSSVSAIFVDSPGRAQFSALRVLACDIRVVNLPTDLVMLHRFSSVASQNSLKAFKVR
jgi:hypothetical protein